MSLMTLLLWTELLCRTAGKFALRSTSPTEATLPSLSFPANTERLRHVAALQKPHELCVMTDSNTEIPDIAAFWRGVGGNTQPTHLVG